MPETGQTGRHGSIVTFTAVSAPAVDSDRRTIQGIAVPWGQTGYNGYARWRFDRGSITIPADPSRVKVLRDHMWSLAVGRVTEMRDEEDGLHVTLSIARGARGDEVLALAADGVLDGLSIGPSLDDEDTLIAAAADARGGVAAVTSATPVRLAEVSLTPCPALEDARVTSVTQSRRDRRMTEGGPGPMPEDNKDTNTSPAALTRADLSVILAGITETTDTRIAELSKGLVDAIAKIPVPQATSTPVATVVEAPVYALNGLGHSYVRDAWNAKAGTPAEQDVAIGRLRKYSEQTRDWALGAHHRSAAALAADATTSTVSEVIPPGYRPDLYVGQLPQGRTMVEACSRGAITSSTPFTIPTFTSATDLVDGSRVEGATPTPGDIALDQVTVTPVSKAGRFQVSRELIDAANPAVDAIVMNAMREDYARKTEQLVATRFETAAGTPDVDPSVSTEGVYLHVTTGTGAVFIDEVVDAMALYWFRRFAEPDRLVLGQDGWTYSAGAKDEVGRYLLPRIAPSDTIGTGGPVRGALDFDGLAARPAWSLNTAEQDAYLFNSQDAWVWESPLLTFRFDEKAGPENVELALFGYFATQILRPSGITAIDYTPGS